MSKLTYFEHPPGWPEAGPFNAKEGGHDFWIFAPPSYSNAEIFTAWIFLTGGRLDPSRKNQRFLPTDDLVKFGRDDISRFGEGPDSTQ